MEAEDALGKEMAKLLELNKQINAVIGGLHDPDEQLVLKYRYILNYTWEEIAVKMNVTVRTAHRWHNSALSHVILPEKPICL